MRFEYEFTFRLCIGKRKSLKFLRGIIQRAHLNTHQAPEYICIHNESEMEVRITGQPIQELSFKSLCTLKKKKHLPSAHLENELNME